MEICAVTSDINRYMHAQDREQERAEAVTEKAAELVEQGEECYPFEAENFAEAINELDLADVAALFARGALLDAASLLDTRIRNYWDTAAEREAERIADYYDGQE